MNVNILAWNVADGLTDPERSQKIQEVFLAKEADLAVFSEAFEEGHDVPYEMIDALYEEGYKVFSTDYHDQDMRHDRHCLVAIARHELVAACDVPTLAGRSALLLNLDGQAQFLGAHFVDRTVVNDGTTSIGGEKQRIAQASTALEILSDRAIIAGDLNALHGGDKIARRLRAVGGFARLLPSFEPGLADTVPKFRRVGSQAQRLADMAKGDTLELLEAAGFSDADRSHAPTMGRMGIYAQLDHILLRGIDVVRPTEVHSSNGISDHGMITATVDL